MIGEKIKFYREKQGLTLTDLAKLVGTTPQTIFKYERGVVTNIPLSRIEQLANVFGIPPETLTPWTGNKSTEPEIDISSLPKAVRAIIDLCKEDPKLAEDLLYLARRIKNK